MREIVSEGNRQAVALFLEGIGEAGRDAYCDFLGSEEAERFFDASAEVLKRVAARQTAPLGAHLAGAG